MLRSTRSHRSLAGARTLFPSWRAFAGVVLSLALPVAVMAAGSPNAFARSAPAADSRIDVNQADPAALAEHLPGVGPVKAQAIVDHRDTQGRFSSVDELLDVKGIGPVTLEKLRPLIFIAGLDAAGRADAAEHVSKPSQLSMPTRSVHADPVPASPGTATAPGKVPTAVSEVAGYYSVDSAPAAAGTDGSGVNATERATVQAVRKVIERVLDDGRMSP